MVFKPTGRMIFLLLFHTTMALQMVQRAGKSLFVQSIKFERFFCCCCFFVDGFHTDVRWRSLFNKSTCNDFLQLSKFLCFLYRSHFETRMEGLISVIFCLFASVHDLVDLPTFLFSMFQHSGHERNTSLTDSRRFTFSLSV